MSDNIALKAGTARNEKPRRDSGIPVFVLIFYQEAEACQRIKQNFRRSSISANFQCKSPGGFLFFQIIKYPEIIGCN